MAGHLNDQETAAAREAFARHVDDPSGAYIEIGRLAWQVRMLTYQRDAMRSLLERLRGGHVALPNRAITTVLNRCDDWEHRRLDLGEVR